MDSKDNNIGRKTQHENILQKIFNEREQLYSKRDQISTYLTKMQHSTEQHQIG